MSHMKQNEGLALLQHAEEEQQPGLITEEQVMVLPPPVQRYLTYTQVVGKVPIQWQAIDAYSVKAVFHMPHLTVSSVLHVNEHGQPTHFTTDRFMEEHGHYRLTPWTGQCNEYREVDGMRIPTKIDVSWQLAAGEFNYFRCRIAEIEYNQSGKVMSL